MSNPLIKETQHWTFDWQHIYEHLFSIIWQLVITTIIFYVIGHFGKKLLNAYFAKHGDKLSKRSQTITHLSSTIFQYTVLFFYLFGILSILGLPVGTLLASAGIFSLAIGMGAQGFVSDLINGFFILNEDQYDVGDYVQIGDFEGTVLRLGIRTTIIQHSDGSLTYIPNRNITNVTNVTHGGYGVNIDLNLSAENDLSLIKKAIKDANTKLKDHRRFLKSAPKVYGIISQQGTSITYRVHLQVTSGNSIDVKNDYLNAYITEMQKNKITFGNPILNSSKSS